MATIVTRSGKGSELTHAELDANFTNLNEDLAGKQASLTVATQAEMEAGTEADVRAMSPLRVKQAFDTAFNTAFDTRVLHGTATCAITSVGSQSIASFTGTVTGAAAGDRVIATPPAQLGADSAGRLSYYAWVSAADTVTIVLSNSNNTAVDTNTGVRTAWPITVIKEI